MFTLTDAAGVRLAAKLVKKSAGDDVALRFTHQAKPGGWILRLDKPCLSDTTLSHAGRVVLVLDQPSMHLLRNKLLDIRETDGGPRLRLRGG